MSATSTQLGDRRRAAVERAAAARRHPSSRTRPARAVTPPPTAFYLIALIVTVFVFDDATQTLLNPEGKRLTMLEGVSPESFIGSGLTQTKTQQIARMSYRAALAVQNYLLDNPAWFNLPPVVPAAEPVEPAN